jgi:VWFA-related protein
VSRAVFQTLGLLLGLSVVVRAQSPQAPQPTFRARVDLIQVDVSVLDRDRQPVSGLTAADFTLTEDGRPRPIMSFTEVHVPPPAAPMAGWMADVAPDVTTNTHPPGRLVVIAVDDGALSTNGALWGVQKARAAARAAVKELGPGDLAALVLTERGRTAQNFTNDRARLLAAIDSTPLFPGTDSPDPKDQKQNWRASCTCGLCSVEGLQRVAQSLRSLPQQRKTILYISPGLGVDITMPEFERLPSPMSTFHDNCERRKHDAILDVFRQAALANVTISAIDPNGIGGGGHSYPEFLRTIAEHTGGRAVTHDNAPERHVPALLLETSSYYLLGFESASRSADGAFHRIEVKVAGRDVEVRSRVGYFAPTRKEMSAAAGAQAAAGSLEAAIGGHLPKADFPLQISAAAFAEANRKSAVAIALSVRQPRNVPAGDAPAETKPTTTVDVLARAFDTEGRVWGTRNLSVKLGLNAAKSGWIGYEILPRLAVPPGTYEIRVAVRTEDARTGSVYTFVDVPDFSHSVVSLSGIVLEATPTVAVVPRDAYGDLLPVVPTARRDFGASDRVSAFVRVYQGGSRALVPGTLTTRIVDAKNEPITTSTRELNPTLFAKGRALDHRFELPRNLAAGEYLFSVEIAADGKTAQRAVRFRVR